jgi:outer membrane beta-barrel protein
MKALLFVSALVLCSSAWADSPKPSPSSSPPPSASTDDEKVNVDSIKQKYWARGDESELGVVQNRLYTKANKFEFSVFGGFISSDPFLSVHNVGGSIGYHLSEYFSVNLIGWKTFSSPSSALETFQQVSGATTNTNPPSSYFGSEASADLLYGKLSLLGKKIIYYDFHLLGGLGATSTLSGTYFTPSVGVGQQTWVSKYVAIRIDYRLMEYHENIIDQVGPSPNLGQVVDSRENWSNVITIGCSFLFGGGDE